MAKVSCHREESEVEAVLSPPSCLFFPKWTERFPACFLVVVFFWLFIIMIIIVIIITYFYGSRFTIMAGTLTCFLVTGPPLMTSSRFVIW